jgi:AraC-like DNA-binding protein
MTAPPTSDRAIPLSEGDIEATNVLPTLDTSLRFGLSEAELFAEVGWRRADLTRPFARVTGESTYKHLELMYARPSYAEFVLAAAMAHDPASLGIVGLACKTVPDMRAAIACHERYQHITNRTARYHSAHEGALLHLREERPGPRRLGSLLMSEYTMFVVVRLLSLIAESPQHPHVRVRAMKSRRAEIPEAERERYASFLGVVPEVGANVAELTFDADVVNAKVKRADPELEAYFRSVLDRAMPGPSREPTVVRDVRVTIRERLLQGTPTVNAVARALGVGSRTLQRRLAQHQLTFADVLEDTRREAAEGYLRTSSLTLSEIAYLLGYGEQASFFRAFRRWHDTTPDAYRRRG